MRCPRCGNQLEQVKVADVTLDVCKGGCAGTWFDAFEMQKFDEPHESAGQELLDVERDETLQVNLEKKLNCPKCENMPMLRHCGR